MGFRMTQMQSRVLLDFWEQKTFAKYLIFFYARVLTVKKALERRYEHLNQSVLKN